MTKLMNALKKVKVPSFNGVLFTVFCYSLCVAGIGTMLMFSVMYIVPSVVTYLYTAAEALLSKDLPYEMIAFFSSALIIFYLAVVILYLSNKWKNWLLGLSKSLWEKTDDAIVTEKEAEVTRLKNKKAKKTA